MPTLTATRAGRGGGHQSSHYLKGEKKEKKRKGWDEKEGA